MTAVTEMHVKLVLTPASLLERVVQAKLPMSKLLDLKGLEDIINPSDLLFYKWVQTKHKSFLPTYVTDVFKAGLVDEDYETSDESKLTEVRFKHMTSSTTDQLKLLTMTSRPVNAMNSEDGNSNSYVGHYYTIDNETIGVVLMASQSPRVEEIKALRGLMSLLSSNYLGSVDGVANNSNDVHIVNLVKTGLLDAFGKLNINQ